MSILKDTFDLSQFDEYREDNRREVKKANGGLPVSLWDTYSSFANCYGGVIILGIKENKDGSWRTTGLQDVSKLRKDFWDTINNSKKVNVNLLTEDDVQTYEVGDNKDVIINLINIGERAGSGVPNIFNVWADEGWEEPVIEERFDPDRTILSLSFLKKEDVKMKEEANFIQKNERSLKEVLKEVLNQKDYEKTLPIIEYLETNSAITTQTARQITGKSLATAWRYIQILIKADVLESDGNTNNAEYILKKSVKE